MLTKRTAAHFTKSQVMFSGRKCFPMKKEDPAVFFCGILERGRRRRAMMLGLLFLLFFVAVFSLRFGSNVSVVKADQKIGEIQYKVIEIQRGDSLWSIAEENMTPGFSDIPTYINEIKRCNQLDSDRITSGHYLMIPYYDAV